MDDPKRKKFVRGMILAWLPSVPILLLGLRAISGQATGFGFIAGSAALYAVPALPCEVAAVFLLLSSFSRQHPVQAFFSALSILWGGWLVVAFAMVVSSAITGAF